MKRSKGYFTISDMQLRDVEMHTDVLDVTTINDMRKGKRKFIKGQSVSKLKINLELISSGDVSNISKERIIDYLFEHLSKIR